MKKVFQMLTVALAIAALVQTFTGGLSAHVGNEQPILNNGPHGMEPAI